MAEELEAHEGVKQENERQEVKRVLYEYLPIMCKSIGKHISTVMTKYKVSQGYAMGVVCAIMQKACSDMNEEMMKGETDDTPLD